MPKSESQTTNFDVVAWLYEQGREKSDACVQERDWCDKMNAAALEIERLREVVWLLTALPPPPLHGGYAPAYPPYDSSGARW